MEELEKSLLENWLKIEYYTVANRAQFINKRYKATYKLILQTIRYLDYMTTIKENPSKEYIITIVALMWEYTNKEEYDLKNFIIKILSRIGYPTSAIVIDNEFDKDECKFFKPKSVFDMFSLTAEQSINEISVKDKTFLLTEFQKSIWDSMNDNKIIGISAPTSAGKSFVILLKSIAKMIKDNLDIVYIVPTLSLLNQVMEDYNKMLKGLGIKNYRISNSFDLNSLDGVNTIFVVTQEKALFAFSNEKKKFDKKIILISDEIQNIERITNDDDLRAKILFDTLIEFKHKKNIDQIIIAGPRIENIDKLGENIFGKNTKELTTVVSPVLNLTYSIRKVNDDYYFCQYCALSEKTYKKKIENDSLIKCYGITDYDDEYLEYLKTFVSKIGNNEQNIIFAPTSKKACEIACYLSKDKKENCISDKLKELIKYYEDTINKNYAMCKSLEARVAYHHGKLPMHVRRTLEKAISDKEINDVVCTTTLMQGMNMPAQNVIIRNPHLYIRKQKDSGELSSYEMANLRGRAGRLLKDFIGRTYVLDESSFENVEGYSQIDIFEDVTAALPSGYGEKFTEYRDDITDAIQSMNSIDFSMIKYGYLVSYIRQSVLRYGIKVQKHLKEVGIELTSDELKNTINNLNKLNIPKDICYKNRYWDPFILDEIYNNRNEFVNKLPIMPNKKGAKYRLDKLMKWLRDNKKTKLMYEKYVPQFYRKGKMRSILCSNCIEWGSEIALNDILCGDRYEGEDASENIDQTINLLERVVSFNIPLLLKPIFDIVDSDNLFLTCIQTGAYNISTRRMIEVGIPRETAIYLNRNLFANIRMDKIEEEKRDNIINNIIKENYNSLPYWIKVQLEFMV